MICHSWGFRKEVTSLETRDSILGKIHNKANTIEVPSTPLKGHRKMTSMIYDHGVKRSQFLQTSTIFFTYKFNIFKGKLM